MSSFKKVYKAFLISTLVISGVLSIARIFLMNYFYDPSLENYSTKTSLPTVYSILFAVCCLAAFAVFFFIKVPKNEEAVLPKSTVASLFASSLCGFFFISSAFLVLYFTFDIFSPESFKLMLSIEEKIPLIALIATVVFSVPSAVFFLSCESMKYADTLFVKVMSFFPPLWCVAYLVYLYFDNSVVINNSEKLSAELSVIFMMLYLTSEARYRIDTPRHRLHLALSLVSIIAVATYCIPNIVLTVMLVLPFDEFSIYAGLQITVLLYMIIRTFQFLQPKESVPIEE